MSAGRRARCGGAGIHRPVSGLEQSPVSVDWPCAIPLFLPPDGHRIESRQSPLPGQAAIDRRLTEWNARPPDPHRTPGNLPVFLRWPGPPPMTATFSGSVSVACAEAATSIMQRQGSARDRDRFTPGKIDLFPLVGRGFIRALLVCTS
jgi:hypothetical protein